MTTPAPKNNAYFGLSTGRLEALSDGVLAIVITLLILAFLDADHDIADSPSMSSSEIVKVLLGFWPHLLGYVLSFVLIAIYWIIHHHMFHYIRRADRGLLWLNMLFLMSVAFVPFPTDLLSACIEHESNVIVVLYGASHLICGLSLAAVWCYATYARRLVAEDIDVSVLRATTQTTLTGPALYSIGIAASFVSTTAALVVYCIVPLLYIVPGRIDQMWLSIDHALESERNQLHRAGGLFAGCRGNKHSANPSA